MRVNNETTKFLVINCESGNAESFHINELVVEHCTNYAYLGHYSCAIPLCSLPPINMPRTNCHVLKFV